MEKKPLVSIIVPVYKVEKYIYSCIDSILLQTYSNLQVILVDDGSPDNCGMICDEYAAKDSRILVIHKKNGGVSSARNVGLQYAEGEYTTFCDSDDAFTSDWIENLVAAAERNQADVVLGNYYQVFEDGRKGNTSNHSAGQFVTDTPEKMIAYCFNKVLSMTHGWEMWLRLFRTKIIHENNIRCCETCGNYAEDMGFVLAYSMFAKCVVSIETKGYLYTMRGNSMMRTSAGKPRLELIDEVYRFIVPTCRSAFSKSIADRVLPALRYQMLVGHFESFLWGGGYAPEEFRDMAVSGVTDWHNMKSFLETYLGNPNSYNRFYSGSENLEIRCHARFLLGAPWMLLRIQLKLIRMFRPVLDAWGNAKEKRPRKSAGK